MTDSKLMCKENATTGRCTDIRKYTYNEYDGDSTLKELNAQPDLDATPPPWTYNSGAKLLESAATNLVLKVGTDTVTEISITPNDSHNVTVDIEGPNNATVDLNFEGSMAIGAISVTLDGTGNGSVQFGPTNLCCTSPKTVKFKVNDPNSTTTPVELSVNIP